MALYHQATVVRYVEQNLNLDTIQHLFLLIWMHWFQKRSMRSLLTSHFNSKLIKVSRSVQNWLLSCILTIIWSIWHKQYHIILSISYGADCRSRLHDSQLSIEHIKKTNVRATNTEITVIFHDVDGSEAYAKRAASQISKKLKSFPGLTSVDVEYSGSPPGMSGGAVFGIIFLVATIVAISGFAYIKDWFKKLERIRKMDSDGWKFQLETLFKTIHSVIVLEILLVAQSKIKTITVVAMMETQLMRFHQWNRQQLLKQLKLPRLLQLQLQLVKSKRE